MSTSAEPPTGLLRTLPRFYASKKHEACIGLQASIKALNAYPGDEEYHVSFLLPQMPKHVELLHFYVLIAGRIRYRFPLVGITEGREVECWDGTLRKAGALAICIGPVSKPPEPIERSGFRGFQYVHQPLW